MTTGTGTDGASTQTTQAGETPKPSEGETLSRHDVESIVTAALSGYTSKVNGELAGLRKRIDGKASGGETPSAPPPPATLEDVRLSREVGKLEASLGEDVIAALGDDYQSATPAEQARLLRIAANLAKRAPAAETAGQNRGGEMPAFTLPNARGQAPQARSAVTIPRTMGEFLELKRKDPRAAHELYQNPGFDPLKLQK